MILEKETETVLLSTFHISEVMEELTVSGYVTVSLGIGCHDGQPHVVI